MPPSASVTWQTPHFVVSSRQEEHQGAACEPYLGQKMRETRAPAVTLNRPGMVDKPCPALNLSFLICPISLCGSLSSHTPACTRISGELVQTEFRVPPPPPPRISDSGFWGRARESAFLASSLVVPNLFTEQVPSFSKKA